MDEFYNDEYYAPTPGSKMAAAALVLAFLSIALFSAFYIAIPMAAVAVILALLSRGNRQIGHRGKLAIFIASAAILISGFNTAYLIYRIQTSPVLKQRLEYMLEQLYGGEHGIQYTSPAQPYSDGLQNPQDSSPDWSYEGGKQI